MKRRPKTKRQLISAIADVSRSVMRVLDGVRGARDVAAKFHAAQAVCLEGWVVRDSRTSEALSSARGAWEKYKLVRSLARRKTSGVTEVDVAAAREELERTLRICELAARESPLADFSEEGRDVG